VSISPGPWAKTGRALVAVVGASLLIGQVALASGLTWASDNRQGISDRAIAWQFQPDPVIEEIVSAAGLSKEGELYLYASLPEVVPSFEFDLYCSRREPGIGVLGCYRIAEKRIYIYEVTDGRLRPIVPVVTAHEMLHAAWYRFDRGLIDDLSILLEEAFAELPADHRLRERIATYEENDPTSRIPELYAILGTEVAPLPAELEDHYSRFFDDRTKVVGLANEVYRVFDTLTIELERLLADLELRGEVINDSREAYEEKSALFQADLAVYNDRVARYNAGENVPGADRFGEVRDGLLARQSALRAERQAIQALIDEYNELYEQLEVLNRELSELNQGINIAAVEPQDTIEPDTDTPTDQ
jgi:hypothetical protein